MPGIDPFSYGNPMQESRRRCAWETHYRAKGCTDTKARDVAWRKCKSSSTWPPKG